MSKVAARSWEAQSGFRTSLNLEVPSTNTFALPCCVETFDVSPNTLGSGVTW